MKMGIMWRECLQRFFTSPQLLFHSIQLFIPLLIQINSSLSIAHIILSLSLSLSLSIGQMSIMNQAISPKGQPGFPHKASGPQEASSHHVPMALPLTHPLKQFQPGLSTRNNLSTIATGSPVDVAPSRNDLSECDPWALTFSRSIIEDENLNLLTEGIQRLDQNNVLTVAVSSAVKLDGKQIELISKKMRRLTGFRNLRLENIIDNSVIAGFVISYEDAYGSPQVIDLSVNGQLAALAARVESSDRRIIGHGQ